MRAKWKKKWFFAPYGRFSRDGGTARSPAPGREDPKDRRGQVSISQRSLEQGRTGENSKRYYPEHEIVNWLRIMRHRKRPFV